MINREKKSDFFLWLAHDLSGCPTTFSQSRATAVRDVGLAVVSLLIVRGLLLQISSNNDQLMFHSRSGSIAHR
jgi:hypothetical protein